MPRYALPLHMVCVFVTILVIIKFGFAAPEVIQAMAVAIEQVAQAHLSICHCRYGIANW